MQGSIPNSAECRQFNNFAIALSSLLWYLRARLRAGANWYGVRAGYVKRSLRRHAASQYNCVTTGAHALQRGLTKSAGVQLEPLYAGVGPNRLHRHLPSSPTPISIFGVNYPQTYPQAEPFTLFSDAADNSVYNSRPFSFNVSEVIHRFIHNSSKRLFPERSSGRLKRSFHIRQRIDEVSYFTRTPHE